ncbi:SDR family NAD(P)-dependent oxidoreductase [bacterium]|nr:SDR family NAD(P)-dependent oxidoreductase [bacterium]
MRLKKFKKFLVYGAGASGVLIKQLIDKNRGEVIAFIDDNIKLSKRRLVGIDIVHSGRLKLDFIKSNSIEAIVVSNLDIHLKQSRFLAKFNIPIFSPNDVSQWEEGYVSNFDIKEIDPAFILNRKVPMTLDKESKRKLENSTILVTGASGSIGSEIVRQLCTISGLYVILIDIDESGLFDLANNLQNKDNVSYHVCDISNYTELERVFKQYPKIDSVFHAAAYKHVPIVEVDPFPAVRVNIKGTRNLCEISDQFSVRSFTLVSTDKAVNPTNIMGATKRCAELITTDFAFSSRTSFRCTRFGNVIGSRGSALPTFISQIRDGGPVTLTHSDITRYFMTIPEATQLVIKASIIGDDGGIFIFDMGEPIKLVEIIEMLKSYYNASDVQIQKIGLREGEKMFEELNRESEVLLPTTEDQIFRLDVRRPGSVEINKIVDLISEIDSITKDELCNILEEIIPEYSSSKITKK